MKKILIFILLVSVPLQAYGEISTSDVEVQPMPPLIDLEDSKYVEDMLIKAYIERAQRENYYDAIDGRFGGQKPIMFYVERYYQDKAKEEALREQQAQSGHVDQMLNDALKKESEIRSQLLDLQNHYGFAKQTINEQFIRLWWLEDKLKSCKKTKGRKC